MAAAARWRGLADGAAPVFASEEEQRAYAAACDAEGSNPERPGLFHGCSLLVAREQLERVLWPLRAARAPLLRDCAEFVLNPRDHPLKAAVEAFCPLAVLSQYSSPGLDLRLPATAEDYQRCWPGFRFGRDGSPAEGLPAAPPWRRRWDCAVFRGGATGGGVTPETNPRLRLAWLSAEWRRPDGSPYAGLLDARLTGWNLRQKLGADGVVRLLDVERARRDWGLDAGPWHRLSWRRQANYKYGVYLEGNAGASRLGAMLGLGFAVLAPPHVGPTTWLWEQLVPGVHYLPLASDLGDLGEKLLWLRAHDEEARRLSAAARALWEACCTREAAERATARLLASLPRADEEVLRASLAPLFEEARSGVYCLVDRARGRLLLFVPFANEAYESGREWLTDPEPLDAFLELVRQRTKEEVALPPQRWWTNGPLVCNVPHLQVWGEGLLPQLRLLLERSAARLRDGRAPF
jgi:hypothetical protein